MHALSFQVGSMYTPCMSVPPPRDAHTHPYAHALSFQGSNVGRWRATLWIALIALIALIVLIALIALITGVECGPLASHPVDRIARGHGCWRLRSRC